MTHSEIKFEELEFLLKLNTLKVNNLNNQNMNELNVLISRTSKIK